MSVDGSSIAKNGFRNEQEIIDKFNVWSNDEDAQAWLIKMGYVLDRIEYVKAERIPGVYKSDVNVLVQVKLRKIVNVENIQVKLVSNKRGYNQVDKRWLRTYNEMWHFPDNVYNILEYFTGTKPPFRENVRDPKRRRMFLDEFSIEEQQELIDWFTKNRILIITDILKGRGHFSAEWILVAQKIESNARWQLCNINEAIQHYYGNGEVAITKLGSLKLGRITLQRKGGDGGAESANMLQFKLDPTELFDI
ncbi:hypothetical protein [Porphyromonas somerae]|uniref:hypothetical protein n=1 Tax=Porphyromonas somerae TaxID=322095 RepID=UPI002A826BD8|nr:hypothetical protein [Porphyromonas somerae]MDY3885055.1 hypothetical protein [Porphyromonas somerae]